MRFICAVWSGSSIARRRQGVHTMKKYGWNPWQKCRPPRSMNCILETPWAGRSGGATWGTERQLDDLVCEFGQPALCIIPWDKLCTKVGIDHYMIPRCVRRWVLHRIQQPGLRKYVKSVAIIIANKVGQPYTTNGIVPPRGQKLKEWRSKFVTQLQDLARACSTIKEHPGPAQGPPPVEMEGAAQ